MKNVPIKLNVNNILLIYSKLIIYTCLLNISYSDKNIYQEMIKITLSYTI
jgi:hypothetical protein